MNESHKEWSLYSSEKNSWLIFKIMGEFVEGFEKMEKIGPCVCIYGSARLKTDNPFSLLATKVAELLAIEGFGVLTGAGPGIMEAANKGASLQEGVSAGLHINLPQESAVNPYVDSDKLIKNKYFFVRKVLFVKYSQAFIVFPGGFGTLDELFECLTLVQTKKMKDIPIILVGKDFWSPLLSWIHNYLLKEGCIAQDDFTKLVLLDDPHEIVDHIKNFYKSHNLKPNF